MTSADDPRVDFEGAVEVIVDLAAEHQRLTGRPLSSIVFVGGTALAAHSIRARSDDVDIYASEVDDDVLDRVTRRHAGRFGLRFKIDATPSNTVWGAIALTDIASSPVVRQAGGVAIRALSVETLYLVKTAADRHKDGPDIRAIAARTSYDLVLDRAKQLFPWYADRSAFAEHAERLARYMARDFRKPLAEVDKDFALPPSTAAKVLDIRRGMEAQFMHVLKGLISQRPDLITYSTEQPEILSFDAKAAGATEEVQTLARSAAAQVSDIAASVLKTRDPARHALRLVAIKNLRGTPGL